MRKTEKHPSSKLPANKVSLSVALATFNEASCLAACLDSINSIASEIVIVDGSSSDTTVAIAQKYTNKITVTANHPIFHINKQKAIDQCAGDWILQLDADETVPKQLADEIIATINGGNPDMYAAYWLSRRKLFLGRWIRRGGQYPDPVIRLFKRGQAYLPCISVHEQMVVKGEVGWLKTDLIHIPNLSFSSYLTKDNRYTTLTAQDFQAKKIPLGFLALLRYFVWEPGSTFFNQFIRHRGFVDGFPGFVFAFYSGLHRATAYVKYWEMQNGGRDNAKDWV